MQFQIDDNNKIVIPNNMVDLQDFTQALWDKIFDNEETNLIPTYNLAAEKYNDQAGWEVLITIKNYKEMATKKAAADKAVTKKATPVKKAAVSTVEKTLAKVKTVGAPSQKSQIVKLAEKGKTIDQIVEATGIKKANVSWYFSKLKLGK